jgi:hypothetical protein
MSKILVSLNEFIEGLKTLKVALKGKNPPDVVFECRNEILFVNAGGSWLEIPGRGHWEGQARVKGKAIAVLNKALPETDPLPITQSKDKIGFGNLFLGCSWEESASQFPRIPINASLTYILGLWQRYTDEDIEKSGMKPKFIAANQERIKRINLALKQLAPLDVTEEDLTTLVDEVIKRSNLKNFED